MSLFLGRGSWSLSESKVVQCNMASGVKFYFKIHYSYVTELMNH